MTGQYVKVNKSIKIYDNSENKITINNFILKKDF